ncbi:hypothetical protein BGZ52_000849 [Haplosporangium bisporale]|nr:hypothetical protein BGZ52_000849 [Haplosporangium bisporale]
MAEGQSTSRAFSVKVSPSDTTDDLKKLIAAENIPGLGSRSRELDLYIVNIPDDHFNEKEPIHLKSIQFKRFPRITNTVSDVFEDTLPRSTIHIMVERPPDRARQYFLALLLVLGAELKKKMRPEYTTILADGNTVIDMSSSTEQLQLFGIVDGQSLSKAFSVRVSSAGTVDDLKKLIKAAKAPSFDHIPADELRLVSVSIPYDHEEELESIRVKTLVFKRPLRPIENLLEVFGDPVPRDSIHFIIENTPLAKEHKSTFMSHTKDSTFSHRGAPSKQITLFGLRGGDRLEQVFSVKVDPSDTVDDLKKLVKAAKHPKFDHMPADELTLFCVDIPYISGIDEFEFGQLFPKRLLHPMETLSDVFGESVPRNVIHFRVVAPRWGE